MIRADFDARVLGVIRRAPDVRAVEIAERLGVEVAPVTASLYRLKRAGKVRGRGATKATTYRVLK